MATCKKCENKYMSKKCPECNNVISKEIRKKYKKPKKKLYDKLIIISIILAIITVSLNFIIKDNNPLIGTWQMKKNMPMIGKMEMIFKKDKAIMMGIVSKVEYEIEDDEITVTDQTGTGVIFKIINKNTILYGAMGINMKLYRVK